LTVGSLYAQSVPERLPLASAAAIEMLAAASAAWAGIGYLVVFGSLVDFTAFAYCLNELPATTVGTYAYVNPVVAVVLGAALLGEPLTPGLLGGGSSSCSRWRSRRCASLARGSDARPLTAPASSRSSRGRDHPRGAMPAS
jgi:hypothetical protein